MNKKYWMKAWLVALTLIPVTSSAFEFHCLYDPSPLPYGASPTLWSELTISSSDSYVFKFASIMSTATTVGATVGPQSNTWTISPSSQSHPVQWILAAPPFSSEYSLQSYGRMWFFIRGATPVFYPSQTGDFCAAVGFVSPQF